MSDGIVGRAITLTWNGVTILGVREKDLTLDGKSIDVTSDENSGYQTLLTVPSQKALQWKLTGVLKTDLLKQDWMSGNYTRSVVITYPNGSSISGSFYMSAYDEKGSYKDAVTFDCTLDSTGQWTFIAGSTNY